MIEKIFAKWYTSSKRRPRLLERANILALHSIVNPPATVVKEGYTTYTTLNNKYHIPIPTGFKPSSKIGDVHTFTDMPLTSEEVANISEDYCIIVVDNKYVALDISSGDVMIGMTIGEFKKANTQLPFETKNLMVIEAGDIENYTNKKPLMTTYGRYICNYFLLAYPFCRTAGWDTKLSFVNDVYNIGKMEAIIAPGMQEGRITIDSCGRYIDHGYYLSTFGEIWGTVATWESIVPSQKILDHKAQLLEKYKDQLDDPRVMIIIENELINMDKDNMRNDPAMDFLGDAGKKFNIHRKRLNCSMGMVEEFGDSKGKYNYVHNSLSEGWDPEQFHLLQDDSRKGFYGRTVETIVGGMDSKWMMSNFQNNSVTESNCNSKELLVVTPTKSTVDSFIGAYVYTGEKTKVHKLTPTLENIRNIQNQQAIFVAVKREAASFNVGDYVLLPWGETYQVSNKASCKDTSLHPSPETIIPSMVAEFESTEFNIYSLVKSIVVDGFINITSFNKDSFIDKQVSIRSMQYCKAKDGFCSVCVYKTFTDAGYSNVGAASIDIGGVFVNLSMKAMHGTKVSSFELEDIDEYVLNT